MDTAGALRDVDYNDDESAFDTYNNDDNDCDDCGSSDSGFESDEFAAHSSDDDDSDQDNIDADTEAIQTELAHVMFRDVATATGSNSSNSSSRERSLADDKLLDMLQRRLLSTNRVVSSSSPSSSTTKRLSNSATHESQPLRTHSSARSAASIASLHAAFSYSMTDTTRTATTPSLSPEKIGQMVRRFRLQEEKRMRKLRAKRDEVESQEHTGCTHAPALNLRSRKLTDQVPTFLERQRTHLLRRKQQDDARRVLLERERTCDLETHVKTPCICSSSATGPVDSTTNTVEATRHTPACRRFMAMCRTMNASFAVQQRKDAMARSVDDMLAYHEATKQRQHARSAIARAREAAQATFAPQINARSEQIYAEMVRSGRLSSEFTERVRRQHRAPPVVPMLSFRPSISKRSRALLLKKRMTQSSVGDCSPCGAAASDVFDRLHTKPIGAAGLTSPVRSGTYSREATSTAVGVTTSTACEWRDIAFDVAKHSFILDGFGVQAPADNV